MKILFLQGPPRSGKDFLGSFISRWFNSNTDIPTRSFKFADPINKHLRDTWGVDCNDPNFDKDIPRDRFGGKSLRDLAIDYSENVIKPRFGKSYFGEEALKSCQIFLQGNPGLCIFTDSGFEQEAVPIVDYYRPSNCRIIQVHKEGKCFKNDSRSLWLMPGVEHGKFDNNPNPFNASKLISSLHAWIS